MKLFNCTLNTPTYCGPTIPCLDTPWDHNSNSSTGRFIIASSNRLTSLYTDNLIYQGTKWPARLQDMIEFQSRDGACTFIYTHVSSRRVSLPLLVANLVVYREEFNLKLIFHIMTIYVTASKQCSVNYVPDWHVCRCMKSNKVSSTTTDQKTKTTHN